MSPLKSQDNDKPVTVSKLAATLVVIGEIIVNSYIIWYLLIGIPSDCSRLASVTNGQQTCGIEAGAYVIAGVSALLILLGAYYLIKGNLRKYWLF